MSDDKIDRGKIKLGEGVDSGYESFAHYCSSWRDKTYERHAAELGRNFPTTTAGLAQAKPLARKHPSSRLDKRTRRGDHR